MNDLSHHPLPQPEEIDVREREDAMGAYLMMFAALAAGLPLPILNLVAAVIYYFINRKKSRFVNFHSLQSVLSQLPTSLMNAAAIFWGLRILLGDWTLTDEFKGYVLATLVANLAYIAFSILAAVRARQGRMYYFLLFGRIAYDVAFRIRGDENMLKENKPPSL